MFAIIETGGKQYRVSENDFLFVEKLEANEGDTVVFDKVLMVNGECGKPYVKGACVTAVVDKIGKAKKVLVFKYKQKKNYRRTQGHRQPYTKVTIKSINK